MIGIRFLIVLAFDIHRLKPFLLRHCHYCLEAKQTVSCYVDDQWIFMNSNLWKYKLEEYNFLLYHCASIAFPISPERLTQSSSYFRPVFALFHASA